jgi:hypothetical protein
MFSSFDQGDASDNCDSLFGDSGYISTSPPPPTSKVTQNTISQVRSIYDPQEAQCDEATVSGQGVQLHSEPLPPPRREGLLGPRIISVATFDKKTGQLVTTKRKQKTLDYQNPPPEWQPLSVSVDREEESYF